MINQFSGTALIFSKDGMTKPVDVKIAIFGIGRLDLFDDDKVCLPNISRQIHATRKTGYVCPPGTMRKCTRRQIPGSNAFIPSVVGLIVAGEVIKNLTGYMRR